MKTTLVLLVLCTFLLFLGCKAEQTVTVTKIIGDHEVVLSNGRSLLVENAYDEAFMVGTVLIIK